MAGIGPTQGGQVEKYLDPSHARRLAESIIRLPHPEGRDGERLSREYYAGFERMRRETIELIRAAAGIVVLDEEE